MELFEFILLLLAAVLVSSALDQAVSRVSLPLVQIVLGVLIVIFWPSTLETTLDPELFLVLFVAPLLFEETRQADKLSLWANKFSIISLAIGLVIVTTLAIGYLLNFIEPSIPLAAAFALGAALGPTDAVAVSALSKDMKVSPRQQAMLSGEALINDASGVVSFQFALAAVTTSAFSLYDASISFCVAFFGGLAAGLILGFAIRFIKRFLHEYGLDSTMLHVVFELFSPFVIFIFAEHFEFSGIIAVVAAGLAININPERLSTESARVNIVSSSVWEVLVFVINGIVFVLLGMQLPQALLPSWRDDNFSSAQLIALVFIITFVMLAVRFVWLIFLEHASNARKNPSERQTRKSVIKSALATAIAGPKGAVTLSIILSIPLYMPDGSGFPERSTLIFLASGSILLTLLLANLLLPFLAPKQDKHDERMRTRDANVKIIKHVIDELRKIRTNENSAAVDKVIRQYRGRMKRIRSNQADDDCVQQLRIEILGIQGEFVHEAIVNEKVSPEAGQQYASRLKHIRKLAIQGKDVSALMANPWRRAWIIFLPKSLQRFVNKIGLDTKEIKYKSDARYLTLECTRKACEYLETRVHDKDKKVVRAASLLLMTEKTNFFELNRRFNEEKTEAFFVNNSGPVINLEKPLEVLQEQDNYENIHMREIQALAFQFELEEIQNLREKGEISNEVARALREDVYLLQLDQTEVL